MATNRFWRDGEPFVWSMAGALSFTLLCTLLLIFVVIKNGMGVFWPSNVAEVTLKDGRVLAGEIVKREDVLGALEKTKEAAPTRLQLKVGNREFGMDFAWVRDDNISGISYPEEMVVLERLEYGNFYGRLEGITIPDEAGFAPQGENTWQKFTHAWEAMQTEKKALQEEEEIITRMAEVMSNLRDEKEELLYEGHSEESGAVREITGKLDALQREFDREVDKQTALLNELRQWKAGFSTADGREKDVEILEIVRYFRPNQMSTTEKIGHYLVKIKELLLENPRESNTEGGLFPAIFGTVMMVFLMSILSFPLGVIAGIYLREYAKEGLLVRTVRIAVNNLAGIPSIVYGIFGLGFFVYGIGGAIDQMFFPEQLPTPTYGTGGILWASLTLGLLTVPVVIVSTEEALGQIGSGVREGSLALGATKFQTLCRVLLPMASPGIMTGFILAMARAAGEVAPLMLTGVMKIAPSLPIDSEFPFFHLDRKFMHLGFHIYDMGFQSPNVEAAKPMVYVTTFLLVLIVLIMSSLAIYLRNKMRKKYHTKGI